MINKLNLISENLAKDFQKILNYKLTSINAYYGGISLNDTDFSIDIGVNVVFTFNRENSFLRFRLVIQGDDYPVSQGKHIGLKFELMLDSFVDATNLRFRVDFLKEYTIQKISFWSFAWKASTFPKIINDVVLSLKDGKNLFIHLGSTCDATLLIKEQSIKDYFNEKNQFYDNEFEVIEILKIE
jgi:hypothetical protein